MAVLALAAAGAWLAPAGYAAIGWTIGSALGTALFSKSQNITQEGPRLADLSVQTSTDGAPIMDVFGAARVAGNIIWSAGIRETKNTTEQDVGGKGGGGTTVSSTTYTYDCSFAVSLCKGPIAGVRRVWADGKLVYDYSATASPSIIVISGELNATIYLGDESQLPDPTIEAHEGAGNVPAYRGQAYIVFENLSLTDYGNRIPNFTFEVLTAGDYGDYARRSSTDISVLANADNYNGQQAPYADELGVHLLSLDGPLVIRHHVLTWDGSLIHIEDKSAGIPLTPTQIQGRSDEAGTCWQRTVGSAISLVYVGPSGTIMLDIYGGSAGTWAYSKRGNDLWAANLKSLTLQIYSRRHGQISFPATSFSGYPSIDITDNYVYVFCDTTMMRFDRATGAYINSYAPPAAVIDAYNLGMARAVTDNAIEYVDITDKEIWVWTPSSGAIAQKTVGLSLESAPNYSSQSILYGWQVFNLNGVYAVWYSPPSAPSRVGIWTRSFSGNSVSLQSAVSAICVEGGLQPSEINVSGLSGNIAGYVRTQPMTARAALEPLMRAHFFDAIESGQIIKFVPRGGASAVTIAEADLAAHADGESLPDAISIDRTQELELPREVVVLYMDVAADYQQGSQSARRIVTQGRDSITVELPMVLTADRARQVAEVLLTDAWMARRAYPISLPPRYIDLEPTDVITLAGTGATHVVRLIDQEIGANGVIRCQAVAESAAVYTSSATGAAPAIPAQQLTAVGPTNLQMMDIPLLRDQDDAPGCYLAAAGYLSGWKGAVIEQSRDNGESWSTIGSKLTSAVMGVATSTLSAGPMRLWDHANSVNVRIPVGTLSSSTEDGVLGGANVAMLGVHGRWEILQFRDAVLEADGTWTLSHFLRGCFGTEYSVDKHASNDVFILIASTALLRILQAQADVGVALQYHALSIGAPSYTPATIDFTNTGLSQRPYPVSLLAGIKQANGDWLIQWTPRVRKGQNWMSVANISADAAITGYQVDIMSGSTVVRSVYVTGATSFTYPIAGQASDFGTGQSTLKVRVYPYNSQVGLGHGVEITAPATTETYLAPAAFTATAYTATTVGPTDPAPEPTVPTYTMQRVHYYSGGNFYASAREDTGHAHIVVGDSTAATWEVRGPLSMGIARGAKTSSYHGYMINSWFARSSTAADGSWTYVQRDNHPQRALGGGYYYDMVSDGTRFIACGARGILESTTDFVTWTEHAVGQIGLGAELYVIRYGNGAYLLHGTEDGTRKIWRSTDRVTWTAVTPAGFTDHRITDMIYAGGKWVMVGSRPNQYSQSLPVIWTSSDNGLTWTQQTDNGVVGQNAGSVAHNGSVFVVIGFRYRATSSDGVTWTAASDDTMSYLGKMVANGALIVAVDTSSGLLRKTTDGVTWTTIQ